MFQKSHVLVPAIVMTALIGLSRAASSDQRIQRVMDGRQMTLTELTPVLRQHRIIIVGEHHGNETHHRFQLQVIQILKKAGTRVAVGLEMFHSESQAKLDRWLNGEMSSSEFEKVYYENWNFPWRVYRPIFEYAKDHRIPMIGLNVSRKITGQVAQKGFQSLSDDQRRQLHDVTCRVDEAYMNYIRKAYGAHAHGKMEFMHFCEAQLVWDSVMAAHAVDYLEKNPGVTLILLCGAGHAQKPAIPRQILDRSRFVPLVFLPEDYETLSMSEITPEDADYLFKSGKLISLQGFERDACCR